MRVSATSGPGVTIWLSAALLMIVMQAWWWPPAYGDALTAPTNLRVTTPTANRIDLAWDNGNTDYDGFRIERAPDVSGSPGSFEEIATQPGSATTYGDKGLVTVAAYWYRVRAYRGSEYGPYSNAVSATPCIGGVWQNLDTGTPSTAGLGLREPPVPVIYGSDKRNGSVVWPRCVAFGGAVRIPVLMVDWDDFDPRVNRSNENNSTSTFPEYVPSTPAQLSSFLQSEVTPYFSDVSGGRATVSFDVVGWIRSGSPGGYLKPRSQYVYNLHDLNPSYPDPTWQCRGNDIFLDALRDAIVQSGVDVSRYDLDGNGLLDGAVLVYEGKGGLCGGGNLSWVNAGYYTNPPAFQWLAARELVPAADPNWAIFNAQQGWVHLYNNMPERLGDSANSFYFNATWVHELGHLFVGYPDYYYSRFNLGSWVLSGNHGAVPTHPAALEKWWFAHWIDPAVITAPGDYTIAANEIPDGGTYSGGPYLYRVPIDGDPNHFLTIEGRWFDSGGNTGTRWAQANLRESGLLVVEFNLAQDWYASAPPQLYRHVPDRASGVPSADLRAFRPGDRFYKCYAASCVTIEPIAAAGGTFSFSVRFGTNQPPSANAGGPYSGVADQPVALNGSASSDPEGAALSYQWSFGDGAIGAGAIPTHTYSAAGSYTVTLVVNDGVATSSPSTTTVSVVNQMITVTSPNTAVNWGVGSTQTIGWTHNLGAGSTVNIDASRDGGATWSTVASAVTNAGATTGSYAWVVSSPSTTAARIRVRAATGTASDASDTNFTIAMPNQAPVAKAGGPYSGVANRTVAFNGSASSDPDGNALTYQWTFGDGEVSAGVSPTHAYAVAGSYTVTLVVSDGIASSSPSTTTASVVNQTITVTAPNTAVNWGVGSTQTIAWTHNLGTGSTVNIDASRDGGITWSAIASAVTNGGATTGSYVWVVTNPTTTAARIRVRTPSGSVNDRSDTNSTIAAPFVTVTSPKSGVFWTIGSIYAITWKHNLGTAGAVRIEISRNGGTTWSSINGAVQNSAAGTGTYNWQASAPATSTARVRVTWTANGAVTDRNGGIFTIQ